MSHLKNDNWGVGSDESFVNDNLELALMSHLKLTAWSWL